MKRLYKNFAELNAVEKNGVAFRLQVKNRRVPWVVIAPHGGGIEPGTTEIASAIAGRSCSLYTFDGLRSNGNELLHITSTLFDEPRCLHLVQASDRVLAIHGCIGSEPIVYVGGLDVESGNRIMTALRNNGFEVAVANTQFQGTQPENICNRGRSGKGVQLEISEGLRLSMFNELDRYNRKMTRPIFRLFVNTIRNVILAEQIA